MTQKFNLPEQVKIKKLPPSNGLNRSIKVGDVVKVVQPNTGELLSCLNSGMLVILDPQYNNRHTVYADEYELLEGK